MPPTQAELKTQVQVGHLSRLVGLKVGEVKVLSGPLI